MFEKIIRQLKEALFTVEKYDRALSANAVIDIAFDLLEDRAQEEGEWSFPWFLDYVVDESGDVVIYTDRGKLWRLPVSVSGHDVTIGDPEEVVVEYIPRSNEIKIIRSGEKLKWVAIAGSSVINRSGEIDSTFLFEDFEKNFAERDKPLLQLHHFGKDFAFGTVEGVLRSNNLLLAYGFIDETAPLASSAIKRIEEGGWGLSIGFLPTEEPIEINISGVKIRTYNSGWLAEISILREEKAAHYFTQIVNVKEQRMANPQKVKETLLDFTDNNENLVEEIMEDVGKREREITDEGMITREEPLEMDIDEEVISAISEKVLNGVTAKIEEIKAQLTTSQEEYRAKIDERLNKFETTTRETLGDIEREDADKVNEIIDDLPTSKRRQVKVNYRPTGDADNVERELTEEEKKALVISNSRDVAKERIEKQLSGLRVKG